MSLTTLSLASFLLLIILIPDAQGGKADEESDLFCFSGVMARTGQYV
jgi:hypothetical protein